jgi:DNA-binding NtrC family response regulator
MPAAAPRVLVVDDREWYVQLCHRFLRQYTYVTRCNLEGPCWVCPELKRGCRLTHAHSWFELDEALRRSVEPVDVILLDVDFQLPAAELLPLNKPEPLPARELARLQRYQGIEILRGLRRAHGQIPVILMTAYEELAFEQDADELAAEEYTYFAGEDATDAQALGLLIERVAARRRASGLTGSGFFWGASEEMAQLRQRAEILARGDRPILVLGETGTGKSLLAERVIHPATRRSGRFCSVDLSTIPSTLVAAELFGSERGAFSGAAERAGRFEHADGGTLLLDEIGHLPMVVQRALLAVLQDRRVTRLGSNEPRPVDVKLVAATNEDLEGRVRAGDFRPDLLMRLNPAARLILPPLRQRAEDIPAFVEHFVKRSFSRGGNRGLLEEYASAASLEALEPSEITLSLGGRPRPTAGICFVFSRKTTEELRRARWPGNVRQLELVVESAVVSALGDALRGAGPTRTSPRVIPVGAKLVRDLIQAGDMMSGVDSSSDEEETLEEQRVRIEAASSLREVSRDVERQYMEQLFTLTGGDFARMAETLLGSATAEAARKVRLRFNQLGLRVRPTR